MFVSCTSLPRPPVIVPSGCDQTEGVKGWSDDISSIRMWLQNQSCHAMPAREHKEGAENGSQYYCGRANTTAGSLISHC